MKIHTLDLDFQDLHQAIAVFVLENAGELALVETGPHSTFAHLERALAEKGWSPADFKHVFLSHIHFDHAGAAWAFARAGATVYVHPKGLPHLASPEKLYNSARMIYGDDMDRLWGAMEPIDPERLVAPEHGAIVEAAGMQFQAWYTPGHAVHHIAWEVRTPGLNPVVFTGDVAGVRIGNGPVMPPCPPPDIHIEDWQASIQILRDLEAETLYLTHYGPVHDKMTHLDKLEKHLLEWAAWMRPQYEAQRASEEIVPEFELFMREQLTEAGTDPALLVQYEAANPAFMSVNGLLRYWKKKLQTA